MKIITKKISYIIIIKYLKLQTKKSALLVLFVMFLRI